ncbi:MAG: ISL3 family transposase [Desulfofustis sp. PB-SRB1]|jgi:transposase|nr:ISL3 family transposase [Desulfofustis sp. PB-SRB1]MBL0381256.1 ISL3 family transposase [Desulfofustis sp. PB-SRB1]MBM1004301.1 ISL3 family transposase [Desulfofustis sp. PB-SRB1]HBH30989.1 ISL3 family transposase [Desulfofustis sp.]
MNGNDIISLGLGIEAPWKISGQSLNQELSPHELRITLSTDRGATFPCPVCKKPCKAHDFRENTWRHLNFFQHHCYITAAVPRIRCEEHGVKKIEVPWARKGSKFTLLFEQVALSLVKEMPVNSAARIIGITDKKLWRIVFYYISVSMNKLDLSTLTAIGFDETASKRRHNYVTVFIDLDKEKQPVIFATVGKGKEVLRQFKQFLHRHGGHADRIVEVVCDMSKAFLAGVGEYFDKATVTVDWFHVVQTFTEAVNKVRVLESKQKELPKHTRWATLKNADGTLTENQKEALAELERMDFFTAIAWRVKEKLRWIRKAATPRAATWRLSHFLLNVSSMELHRSPLLQPVIEAIETVIRHRPAIEARWQSQHSTARLEGLNSLFQAARARARGYRNPMTFIAMIYLIASPIGNIINST